jgi:CspA family cold shock protein
MLWRLMAAHFFGRSRLGRPPQICYSPIETEPSRLTESQLDIRGRLCSKLSSKGPKAFGSEATMAKGTVKSFNPSKGYGFIRMDLGGKDVFVHLSAVQKAGLKDLRKGQKIGFEIFENRGKAAAKNLSINRSIKNASKGKLVSIQNGVVQNARCEMSPKKAEQLARKRRSITRAALELAIAEAVRQSDPQCEALITVIIERVVPKSPGGANWAVKGVKYGRAERNRCSEAISGCVEEVQRDFDISN